MTTANWHGTQAEFDAGPEEDASVKRRWSAGRLCAGTLHRPCVGGSTTASYAETLVNLNSLPLDGGGLGWGWKVGAPGLAPSPPAPLPRRGEGRRICRSAHSAGHLRLFRPTFPLPFLETQHDIEMGLLLVRWEICIPRGLQPGDALTGQGPPKAAHVAL